MPIAIVGDIHNDTKKMQDIDDRLPDDVARVVQVGDIGFYQRTRQYFNVLKLKRPWYFIRGNHDDHEYLLQYNTITEVAPNLFYVPNGTVWEMDGQKVGFLGGAGSVDAAFNYTWSPLERITDEEVAKFDNVDHLDFLVTHTPPQETITAWMNPQDLVNYFGLPIDWKDPSAAKVQQVWEKFGRCRLFAGHLHKSIIDGKVRILDIDEVYAYYGEINETY